MSYAIVCFTEDNSIAIVPMSWLEDDKTFWPPYDDQKLIDKAVRTSESPSEEWAKYTVRILGVSGNYENARQKLRTAEMWSDIDSSSESKARHRRAPKRLFDTDDDTCVETRPFGKRAIAVSFFYFYFISSSFYQK
ncbi:hypothetical protein Btru_077604 [Bulinus truncatus]|nr:hypothetical protein Btru_077604 [Bulinus truncatus]